jgi:hypothetical protein
MARALYYIAAVLSFLLAAQAVIATAVFLTNESFQPTHWLLFIQPLLYLVAGTLFARKYRREEPGDQAFDQAGVVSVCGIVAMVWGLAWLAENVRFALELAKLSNEIRIDVIERVLAPVVLASLGAWFGFGYPRRLRR